MAQAQAAFGRAFGMYKVHGKTVRSPTGDVSIPSSLASIVTSVVGLDDSAVFVQTNHIVDTDAPPSAGFRNAPPLSAYWAQFVSPYAYPAGFTAVASPATASWTVMGYTPAQIKGAYGISGRMMARAKPWPSSTPTRRRRSWQDVNQWSINRGLPTMSPSQLVQVVPPGIYRRPQNPRQDPQGWYGEETLDVEAVHGMAPAAKIVFVGAPNNYQDLDAAHEPCRGSPSGADRHELVRFPDTSCSRAGYVKPFEDTLIQAAAEGIGVYFSSGDNGDETVTLWFCHRGLACFESLGNGGRRHEPWRRPEQCTRARDRLGHEQLQLQHDDPGLHPAGWLYGAGGGVSRALREAVRIRRAVSA